MLTNLESQLREQNAQDRLDEVLLEIPLVRKDLGYIPLVTPTSQIVGTQAVLNVLSGERYKNITKETEGVLKGEYGKTPAPVDSALQARVLAGGEVITCRPADLLPAEFEKLKQELLGLQAEKALVFGENIDDDVLTYALFPQPGLNFLANRHHPEAFEPAPGLEPKTAALPAAASGSSGQSETYSVEVGGQVYVVKVSPGGDITSSAPIAVDTPVAPPSPGGVGVLAPLSGNISRVTVAVGDDLKSGDVVVVLEAMKMETEIRASCAGRVSQVLVRQGQAVAAGDTLITFG
jgi:oxaloacetate decarboxylase alpha subunit